MQIPLQITFKDMDPSPAVEARIRGKAAELERFFAHVSRCHVVVSSPHRHRRKGRLYQVPIHLTLPPLPLYHDNRTRWDLDDEGGDQQDRQPLQQPAHDAALCVGSVSLIDSAIEHRRRRRGSDDQAGFAT